MSTTIADIVRIARTSRRWTIREMSKRAGIATMTLQRVEKGKSVRAASWRGLARAFEVDEEMLLQTTGREDADRLADLLGVRPGSDVIPIKVDLADVAALYLCELHGGGSHPRKTVAEEFGVCTSTAGRWLNAARGVGLLKPDERAGGGRPISSPVTRKQNAVNAAAEAVAHEWMSLSRTFPGELENNPLRRPLNALIEALAIEES